MKYVQAGITFLKPDLWKTVLENSGNGYKCGKAFIFAKGFSTLLTLKSLITIVPSGDQVGKRTASSLIYFLSYAYFDI